MTAIVDTSLWTRLFKDKTGAVARAIEQAAGAEDIAMVPPVRLELLQGCRGEMEWKDMVARLAAFETFPLTTGSWDIAARIYFELRQAGFTVRSSLDCCIAQLAIENGALLVHCDRDFDVIASVRSLRHEHLNLDMV